MSQPSLRSHAAAAQLHAAVRTAYAIAAQRDNPPQRPSRPRQTPMTTHPAQTSTQPATDGSTQPVEAAEASIEAEFPGWHVWRTTDAGTWWASRRGAGWNTEPRTLAADTADELRTRLHGAPGTAGVLS